MPTGSIDIDSGGSLLAGDALPVAAYAYDPDSGYSVLPNVVPLRVDRREGLHPSAATFAYVMDSNLQANFGWPARFEQVFGVYVDPSNPYVVLPDQRIVILAQYPDGSPWVLWDGFAQVPAVDLAGGTPTGGHERVTFTGVGVEVRCWDSPISGRTQRDADPIGIVDTTGDSDVQHDRRPRFNPSDGGRGGSLPNCSPKGKDTTDPRTNLTYPVFVDPNIERDPDPRQYWYVGGGVRYVLATENGDEKYVSNPPFAPLDALLQTYKTAEGSAVLNPSDSSTYVVAPCQVPDYDAANQPWPDAIRDLIGYVGFLGRWDTTTDADGLPETMLAFYRRDQFATIAPKPLYLDVAAGQALDPALNNARDIRLSLDMNGVVNAAQVETAQRLVEVSWILAPLYRPAAADAQASSRKKYRAGNLANQPADVRRKYRWYGADECGDGHWTYAGGGSWSTLPCDFSDVFPDDDDGSPSYSVRYRPGSRTLIATDDDGRPIRADLSISFDYAGPARAPWDGTGTWQSIAGGWRLLPDRLGIEVTADDPETWGGSDAQAVVVGAGPAAAALVPGGSIRGITWWADPPSGAPTRGVRPQLRLTTVIEDDLRMPISAGKRPASPTQFPRWRIADRRDVFQYASVHESSMNFARLEDDLIISPYKLDDAGNIVVRDDTDAAQALADQMRTAREAPTISGTVTIPYITDFYQVGDRIESIVGRDCSLQTNGAASVGEAPTYPWVVAVSWTFQPRQETVLTLSHSHHEGS